MPKPIILLPSSDSDLSKLYIVGLICRRSVVHVRLILRSLSEDAPKSLGQTAISSRLDYCKHHHQRRNQRQQLSMMLSVMMLAVVQATGDTCSVVLCCLSDTVTCCVLDQTRRSLLPSSIETCRASAQFRNVFITVPAFASQGKSGRG